MKHTFFPRYSWLCLCLIFCSCKVQEGLVTKSWLVKARLIPASVQQGQLFDVGFLPFPHWFIAGDDHNLRGIVVRVPDQQSAFLVRSQLAASGLFQQIKLSNSHD